MAHRITLEGSRYVTTGHAFFIDAPTSDTLIVDANAYLITGDSGSLASPAAGARLEGSWTVTVNGLVAALGFDDPQFGIFHAGISLVQNAVTDSASIKVGKTGEVYGSNSGVHTEVAATIVNLGVIGGGSASITSYAVVHITNAGKLNGTVRLEGMHDDIFINFQKVGNSVRHGIVEGVIDLGDGADKFTGGAKAETVRDGAGADAYKFGGGSDTYLALKSSGTDGVDNVNGGAGVDTYDASNDISAGITVNLGSMPFPFFAIPKQSAVGTGIGTDGVKNFENAVGGSGTDFLVGSNGANVLSGGAQSDSLTGLGGRDVMIGGAGGDTFRFFKLSDSSPRASRRDVIEDFNPSADFLHLSNIDANGDAAGHGGFEFIGFVPFAGVRGELRGYLSDGDTIVAGDVNGDRKADFSILLTGSVLLHATDFL
jgi:serralysin